MCILRMTWRFQQFLHKINNCYAPYPFIGVDINYCLSLSCNMYFVICYHHGIIIKLFNHSSATVIVIGRPVHRMASVASSHLRYKIYTYILCLNNCPSLCQYTNLMASLLPASSTLQCMATLVIR